MKKILVTGAAGFIGFHLCYALLKEGNYEVIGVDNLNAYYDVTLKKEREAILLQSPLYRSEHFGIEEKEKMLSLFEKERPDIVIHLAAQAGVRYSITHPDDYITSNLLGFYSILECCRHYPVEQLLYASSSSVYGSNQKVPYSVKDKTDSPVSLYAATKKSNELLAYAYSHLYQIPARGVRFFTVYGEWGRPDMAYFSFAKKMMNHEPITLFNNGKMERDFTYVGDIVDGLLHMMNTPVKEDENHVKHHVYNLGNHHPVPLFEFASTLEAVLGKKAIIQYAPMQMGDVVRTYSDQKDTMKEFHYSPSTSLKDGLSRFATWYLSWRNSHHGY